MAKFKFLPPTSSPDSAVLLASRGVRAFVDGLVSTALVTYLTILGFNGTRIGLITSATLAGSGILTIAVGLRAHAMNRQRLLQIVAVMMVLTGIGFATFTSFWLLMVVAIVGTMNPSNGDVSVFLPTEQALLPSTVSDSFRTALFGRYALVGFSLGACGALAAGLPASSVKHQWLTPLTSYQLVFVLYACAGVAVYLLYRKLADVPAPVRDSRRVGLQESRTIVLRMAALFSVDSLGGGFVVSAVVILWLHNRFGLTPGTTAVIFSVTSFLSGISALLAVRIARRIGLVRTMVFTHLPANIFLMLAPFMPNAPLSVACLICRSFFSQMDVPVRSSYVMAVVTPAERPAAASITNVPRSIASALPPLAAGWMLDHSKFGWPLLIGGALKAVYDLVLLRMFRHIKPPEEL